MKRYFALVLAVIMSLLMLAGCRESAAAENRNTGTQQAASDNNQATITKEQAEELALKHAGFTRDTVRRLHTEFDRDRVDHYDVSFYQDRYEYDYEIDAQTGEILDFDKDYDD